MTSLLIIFNTIHCIALWFTGLYYSVIFNFQVFICMLLKLFECLSTICKMKTFLSSCQQHFICWWQIFMRSLNYPVNKVLNWDSEKHIPLPGSVTDFFCDPGLYIYSFLSLLNWNRTSFPQTGVKRIHIYIYMDQESMTKGKRKKKRKNEIRRLILGSIKCRI